MYLKIKSNKVRVSAPILAGEEVIIKVEKPELVITQKEICHYSEVTYEPSTFDELGNEIKGDEIPGQKLESTFETIKKIYVKTSVFAASDLELSRPLTLYDLNSNYVFEIKNDCNSLIASKGIVSKIKETYNLADSDIQIICDLNWKFPERLIRMYIPFESVLLNEMYRAYVPSIIEMGTPYEKIEDGYVLYFEELYPDYRAVLGNDENILIEE